MVNKLSDNLHLQAVMINLDLCQPAQCLSAALVLCFEDLYFHCTAVNKACPFDELRVNDEVSYEAGSLPWVLGDLET